MPKPFSKLSLSQSVAVKSLLNKANQEDLSHDDIVPYDWKTPAQDALREGNAAGIRKAAAPAVQYGVAEIALTSKSDAVRLQASNLLLSQEGQGPIQRQETSIQFEKMPPDQLISIIRARLDRLKAIDPTFELEKLLPSGDVADVDFEEVPIPEKDEA